MANDDQIAVKKRLIYAEDLFEPVDYRVFLVGRSGGKTMAMYEQIFRKRVELAPTVDAAEVVHGRWECAYDEIMGETEVTCSNCKDTRTINGCFVTTEGESCYFEDNYCPNCGAKMDLRGGMADDL